MFEITIHLEIAQLMQYHLLEWGPPYPSGIRNTAPYRPPLMKFMPGPSRPMVYRNRLFNPGIL